MRKMKYERRHLRRITMQDKHCVIGWCYAYEEVVPTAKFTPERKKALIERIKKRKYNFNHFDHEMLGCAPVYDDNVMCVLTKSQFDDVMNEAYKEIPRGPRLMPQDVITIPPKNGVLYEKEKFINQEMENNV
jgi:hypothetical protein